MKKIVLLILFFSCLHASEWMDLDREPDHFVISTRQIILENFPDAFNPSIVEYGDGYLLSFRYRPEHDDPCLNYIGIVQLDENLEMASEPQLLNTRAFKDVKSQSEDARIFSYRGRIFLIYNDSYDVTLLMMDQRRSLFLAEVYYSEGQFLLSPPIELLCEQRQQFWEKNWVPFEWDKQLLISYSINPHEVLYTNLNNGTCYLCYSTVAPIEWSWGTLRGSTPPVLVDGEFLSFFHSSKVVTSHASWGWDLYHYFMGAYTFSAEPPFEITRVSPEPIIGHEFYTKSYYEKRVIFPAGFIVKDSYIYVAYGKDDHEIWLAKLDLAELKKSLVPVEAH